eukprot:3263750-Rhodomonas_salina.2
MLRVYLSGECAGTMTWDVGRGGAHLKLETHGHGAHGQRFERTADATKAPRHHDQDQSFGPDQFGS